MPIAVYVLAQVDPLRAGNAQGRNLAGHHTGAGDARHRHDGGPSVTLLAEQRVHFQSERAAVQRFRR
jgi:hypothetical protein